MRVLGIEGTAWAASAAVFEADVPAPGAARADRDSRVAPDEGGAPEPALDPDATFDPDRDEIRIETDAYVPETGGIDPREAADHMADAIPAVVEAALDRAAGLAASDPDHHDDDPPVDAVAFSRGPGLGPCLRIVGTAARALAGSLGIPLVGVNHMVAHLEIGRFRSGFEDPVCLNASGANAHVLGYHGGRYRVLGETMDTGAGNALDKFARHVGWSHPGGPKVEAAAADGEYVELPYVVKGMDFSFAGIVTAAQDAVDEGTPVEDVCRGLEETVFAMLTEVAERALALTGRDELVLGGGVGQNDRLRTMLETMCENRGAEFHAPEPRFLRDNAGMIAVTGAKMLLAGDALPIPSSTVDPEFRPDEVTVSWRSPGPTTIAAPEERRRRGAEAVVEVDGDRVRKRRVSREYRHPALDERLRRERTRLEARLTAQARRVGVPTPVVRDVDPVAATIEMEFVGDRDLQSVPSPAYVRRLGEHLATIHEAGFVHGDPTPRNARIAPGERTGEPDEEASSGPDGTGDDGTLPGPGGTAGDRLYLIDFGLGYYTDHVEDRAMDLHVFEGSLGGTVADPTELVEAFEAGYAEGGDTAVLDRLRDIERRGRYQ